MSRAIMQAEIDKEQDRAEAQLEELYKGCTIHITQVEGWTVGPSARFRVQIEKGVRFWTEYENSLDAAHQKARYIADYAERLNL